MIKNGLRICIVGLWPAAAAHTKKIETGEETPVVHSFTEEPDSLVEKKSSAPEEEAVTMLDMDE
jgi:hypothetical protein